MFKFIPCLRHFQLQRNDNEKDNIFMGTIDILFLHLVVVDVAEMFICAMVKRNIDF
jgi:hypothetical protein